MRQGFYERNHCEILQGNAHFVDEHTLALECHDGTVETMTAEKFVIACGSRPTIRRMSISTPAHL
jgi:NAD(P) transhydrogenase